jgi:hypothetical protein
MRVMQIRLNAQHQQELSFGMVMPRYLLMSLSFCSTVRLFNSRLPRLDPNEKKIKEKEGQRRKKPLDNCNSHTSTPVDEEPALDHYHQLGFPIPLNTGERASWRSERGRDNRNSVDLCLVCFSSSMYFH